jgi:hypothetical protein
MWQLMRGLVGLAVLLASACVSGGAQELPVEKAEGGTIVEGLQLVLCTEESRINLGQPCLVRVGIRNCTPKPIELRYTGSVTTYLFEVRRVDGSVVPLSKEGTGIEEMRRNASNFGLVVEPGETYWDEVDLARWYELGSSGTFNVVASRSLQRSAEAAKATVRSNTLSISVRQ